MKSIGYLVASLSIAGLLGVAVATQAAADRPGCDRDVHGQGTHHQGHHERGDRFARDSFERGPGNRHLDEILGLTEDQKKTLAAAREKEQAAALALREKVMAARDALFKAAESNASDEELAKLASNSSSLRAQLELGRIKMHRQLVAILTPEQKQKLNEWEAGHKRGRREDI